MAEHVHTFPVDPSLTPEEAWHEICLMSVRTTYTGTERWANIVCDGDECRNIATEKNLTREYRTGTMTP